jgi:WD40 repeat protein
MPYKTRQFTVTLKLHDADTPPVRFTLNAKEKIPNLLPSFCRWTTGDDSDEAVAKEQAVARNELPPGVQPSPELVREMFRFADSVGSLAFSPDGRTLAGSAWNSSVQFVNIATGTVQSKPRFAALNVDAIVYSPDGSRLLTKSSNFDSKKLSGYELRVWNSKTGKEIWSTTLTGDKEWPSEFVFSQDSNTLTVVGGRTEKTERHEETGEESVTEMSTWVRTWDLATGKLQKTVRMPHGHFHPAIAPSLKGVATYNVLVQNGRFKSTTAKLWDARTGKLLHNLPVPDGMQIHSFAITKNSKYVVAAGHRQSESAPDTPLIVVWEAETGQLYRTLES